MTQTLNSVVWWDNGGQKLAVFTASSQLFYFKQRLLVTSSYPRASVTNHLQYGAGQTAQYFK